MTLQVVPIDEATDREVDVVTADARGAAAHRADAPEHPGAPARAAHVELGQQLRRAVPADRRHEREGGRLHHHRRRPRRRAVGDRQRAEDGGRSPCWTACTTRFRFGGIAATLATEPGPELADAQEAERELMPFPVLDACLQLYAGEKMSPDEMAVALGSLFPGHDADRLRAWAAALRAALHAVDLQVGAVAALAARRLARPRSRARAADAGRAEDRVAGPLTPHHTDSMMPPARTAPRSACLARSRGRCACA